MSRARAGRTRRQPGRASRPTKRKVRVREKTRPKHVRPPRPTPAELCLLKLAQELAELARGPGGSQMLSTAVLKLAAAYGPSAPLPQEIFLARARNRGDKTSALALSWAREQVRLGLQEIVERTARGARGRIEVDVETFAWLLLAGCEAIAQEPPSAGADRLRALLQIIGHVSATG